MNLFHAAKVSLFLYWHIGFMIGHCWILPKIQTKRSIGVSVVNSNQRRFSGALLIGALALVLVFTSCYSMQFLVESVHGGVHRISADKEGWRSVKRHSVFIKSIVFVHHLDVCIMSVEACPISFYVYRFGEPFHPNGSKDILQTDNANEQTCCTYTNQINSIQALQSVTVTKSWFEFDYYIQH